MKKLCLLLLIIDLLSLSLLNLSSQETTESPKKASSEILKVMIDAIEGNVEIKRPGDQEWLTASKGITLTEGSKISTGFKSKATLLFADNSTVIVKSLTQLTVNRFLQQDQTIKTRLKLRIGTIRLKVKKDQPVKTDLKISTPNSTASVRGTDVKEIASSPDLGDTYAVESGRIELQDKEGHIRAVARNESTDDKMTPTIEHALLKQVINIQPIGTTESERRTALTLTTSSVNSEQLPGDINSETRNPTINHIVLQENPTPEQIAEFNALETPPVEVCPYCGESPPCATCSTCGYPTCNCQCRDESERDGDSEERSKEIDPGDEEERVR